jgi:RNA polymerase sigma factor (TIGR02999 family)
MPEAPAATQASSGGLTDTIYSHLRAIAQHKLSQERPGHTLQATALVNEAYIRMDKAGGAAPSPAEKARFYWAAAEAMRRILIEHARAKKAVKRGGRGEKLDWTEAVAGVADLGNLENPEEIESLDEAILRLQKRDPRAGDVVRLRFYAGLTLDEVAEALGISTRSAKRDWEYARAWLLRELGGSPPGASAGA